MWDYIYQEQAVLKQQFMSAQSDEYVIRNRLDLQRIYLVAHGSSYNAAVCVKGFFPLVSKIGAFAYTPGEFQTQGSSIHVEDPKKTLVIVISQTGTSTGALQSLEYARSLGFRTLGITADPESPLAQKSDQTLSLLCGMEDSNAKTKGYSSTLLLLLLLAISFGENRGVLYPSKKEEYKNELDSMIKDIPALIEQTKALCEQTSFGKDLFDLYVLGSGVNLGTAQECQLKLMETMCIPTMFNDIGEFSHGMHRAVDSKSSIILLRSPDGRESLIVQAFKYLRGITNKVWMLDASREIAKDDHCLKIPCYPLTNSILLITLAVQVLSVFAPEYNGLDPNRNAHDDFTQLAGTRR